MVCKHALVKNKSPKRFDPTWNQRRFEMSTHAVDPNDIARNIPQPVFDAMN